MSDVTILATLICTSISLFGSFVILLSFYIARTRANPKAALVIRNLALSDLVWFSCVLIESAFWQSNQDVPQTLCFILGPCVNLFRIATLIWTSAISYNVLMSVTQRKWFLSKEEDRWHKYKYYYGVAILIFALPLSILNVVAQHSEGGNPHAGCESGYENLGSWWEILLVETIPITVIFWFNVFVCLRVHNVMAKKSYPQSVRKKRRRLMYHYSLVYVVCWAPTMLYYTLQIAGIDVFFFKILARTTLYLTGFFNFVVFGLQDPHLRRSLEYIYVKLSCFRLGSYAQEFTLIRSEIEKSVMFDESVLQSSSKKISKGRLFKKLSDDDKISLYKERPDLDPRCGLEEPLIFSAKRDECSIEISENVSKENNRLPFKAAEPSSESYECKSDDFEDSSSDDEDEEDEELKHPII